MTYLLNLLHIYFQYIFIFLITYLFILLLVHLVFSKVFPLKCRRCSVTIKFSLNCSSELEMVSDWRSAFFYRSWRNWIRTEPVRFWWWGWRRSPCSTTAAGSSCSAPTAGGAGQCLRPPPQNEQSYQHRGGTSSWWNQDWISSHLCLTAGFPARLSATWLWFIHLWFCLGWSLKIWMWRWNIKHVSIRMSQTRVSTNHLVLINIVLQTSTVLICNKCR